MKTLNAILSVILFAAIMSASVAGEKADDAEKKIRKTKRSVDQFDIVTLIGLDTGVYDRIVGPDVRKPGSLTEPRQFNLMFKTYVGARATEDDLAYLRPETAQIGRAHV